MNKGRSLITGRKFSIKSHSRRTRGGKRVVVKSYSRRAGGRGVSKKKKEFSGADFKRRKDLLSPYGEPIEERLHTFQGPEEDGVFDLRRLIGDSITTHKRKIKKSFLKNR